MVPDDGSQWRSVVGGEYNGESASADAAMIMRLDCALVNWKLLFGWC